MSAESSAAQYCLIVDDEPRLRQVLVHLMRNDGFTCLEAGNGEEAIAQLEKQAVTLVMSDLRFSYRYHRPVRGSKARRTPEYSPGETTR